MHRWDELSDEELEVVQRLSDSAQYTIKERMAAHRWCTRCWFEAVGGTTEA
jgi:hypothetical protein